MALVGEDTDGRSVDTYPVTKVEARLRRSATGDPSITIQFLKLVTHGGGAGGLGLRAPLIIGLHSQASRG